MPYKLELLFPYTDSIAKQITIATTENNRLLAVMLLQLSIQTILTFSLCNCMYRRVLSLQQQVRLTRNVSNRVLRISCVMMLSAYQQCFSQVLFKG